MIWIDTYFSLSLISHVQYNWLYKAKNEEMEKKMETIA